jgi:photosynthetic reaction center cytochrome c subunit
MFRVRPLLVVYAIILSSVSLTVGQRKPPKNPAGFGDGQPVEKTVEQVKKNIKVLNGMPASQLNPVMDYFSASLGVGCDFCHAGDTTGHLKFDSDDKSEKKTAREMIKLVMDINENNFNGKLSVNCYTCHRGSVEPARMPQLPMAMKAHDEEEQQEHPKLPKTEEVLAAYETALGGTDAIQKVKTRVVKAVLARNGNDLPLDIVQEAPDRYAGSVTNEGQVFTNVYNGHDVWTVMKEGARPLPESERIRLSREASMFPLQYLKELRENLRIRGTDTVNGKTTYVLAARIGDNLMERYYIDSATSLLVRRNVMNKTMLAWIPDQADYNDYRTVDGVKVPFMTRYSYMNSRNNSVHHITEVKQNVPVDEKLFVKPEMKIPEMRERK